jgi:drug/metabolite transporter (DMT)-like permease
MAMTTRQESPENCRTEWEALAAKQLWAARKAKLVVWGLFMAILGMLLVAGRLVWLRGFRKEKGWTSLVGVAIGVQFLIAIACSIPAFVVYETGIGTMMPVALLAPVAFVVVAVEFLALSARRLRVRG